MRRLLIASLVTGLLLAGCGTTKMVVKSHTVTQLRTTTEERTVTTAQQPTIFVAASEGLLYKPDSLSFHGGHQIVDRIRWMAYGGALAVGRARFGRDDCNPSCADGHYTYTPITVWLTQRKACHGEIAYTFWHLKGAGLDPVPEPIADEYLTPCR